MVLPVKQGLKLNGLDILKDLGFVEVVLPVKQGLKLIYIRASVQCPVGWSGTSSKTRIETASGPYKNIKKRGVEVVLPVKQGLKPQWGINNLCEDFLLKWYFQ